MRINRMIILVLALAMLIIGSASAAELVVNPNGGGAYLSVTQAVEAAQSGDVIILETGIYQIPLEQFPIEVNKFLEIRAGDGAKPVFEGSAFKTVFRVTANDVTIRGLDIRLRRWGILALADNIVLLDNQFTLAEKKYRVSSCGVWLAGVYNAKIKGNAFTGCGLGMAGPPLSERSKTLPVLTGLFEVGEDTNYFTTHCVEDNTVNGKPLFYAANQTSIRVPQEAGQVIVACCKDVEGFGLDVSDGSIGATFIHCENVKLTEIVADRCGIFGIYLGYVKGGILQGAISNDTNHGIDLRHVQDVLLKECSTDECEQGIFLSGTQQCLLVDCMMTNGGRGLFFAGGLNNQADHCIIRGNENGICSEGDQGLLLSNNAVEANTVAGIRILRGDAICIQNTIKDNWTGMIISDLSPFVISDNVFSNNKACGLYIGKAFQGKIALNSFDGISNAHMEMAGGLGGVLVRSNVFSCDTGKIINHTNDIADLRMNSWMTTNVDKIAQVCGENVSFLPCLER